MLRRWIGVTALAALGVVALGACARTEGGSSASGVPLVGKGKLTVCVNTPFPPFQQKVGKGPVSGFDVDLMHLVSTRLGVGTEIIDTPFEGIKSGQDLATGKCDVAAAGLTVDDERRKVMDFSDPYFDNTQGLVVRAADRAVYPGIGALKGRKVAVQGGTTGAAYAKKLPGIEIVEYSDFGLQQQALTTKQVDAALTDLPAWTEYAKQSPDQIAVVGQFDTGEKYAYAVKKGADPRLLAAVNDTLRASRADGTYAKVYEHWLGRQPS